MDVKYLRSTMTLSMRVNAKDPQWQQAFREYNRANGKKYGLHCRGCYYKVLNWHEQRAVKTTLWQRIKRLWKRN